MQISEEIVRLHSVVKIMDEGLYPKDIAFGRVGIGTGDHVPGRGRLLFVGDGKRPF